MYGGGYSGYGRPPPNGPGGFYSGGGGGYGGPTPAMAPSYNPGNANTAPLGPRAVRPGLGAAGGHYPTQGPPPGYGSPAALASPMQSPPPGGGPGGEKLTVFVGGISAGLSDEWLEKLLNAAGKLRSLKRVKGVTGKPQPFGFAEFAEPDSVLRAIKTLNGVAVPTHEPGAQPKQLSLKADEKTRAFLDEYEKQVIKTDADDEAEKKARAEIAAVIEQLRDPAQTSAGPSSSQQPSGPELVIPRHLQDLQPDELPEEQRGMITSEIAMFRERAARKEAERKRAELARQTAAGGPPTAGGWGPRAPQQQQQDYAPPQQQLQSFAGTPQAYDRPMGFVAASSAAAGSTSTIVSDEAEERARREKKARDQEITLRERERRLEQRERVRFQELDRQAAREHEERVTEERARAAARERLEHWDEERVRRDGKEMFFEDRPRWRSARLQARRREQAADEADRAAEAEEAAAAARDTEAFLARQAQELEQLTAEQKARGVLVDDGMPIRLAVHTSAPTAAPSAWETPAPAPAPVFAGADEEEEEEQRRKRRTLVKLDYSESDGLTHEQREAARRVKLRGIADGVPREQKALWRVRVAWDYLSESVINKKIIPAAKAALSDYFGEVDEELLGFIVELVRGKKSAQEMLEGLEPVMLEDALPAVIKFWRLIVFETRAAEQGLESGSVVP